MLGHESASACFLCMLTDLPMFGHLAESYSAESLYKYFLLDTKLLTIQWNAQA